MRRKGVVFSKMFVLRSMGNELVPSPHIGKCVYKVCFSGTRMNTVDLFHADKQKFKAYM